MYTPAYHSNAAAPTSSRRPARMAVGLGLALAAITGLAACGDDDEQTTTTEATTTDAPAADGTDAPSPADDEIVVVAADYSFDGLPAQLPAGSYTLSFTNVGTEEHEIALFKNPEGLTMEELAELGPEEGPKHVEMAGMLFASPGADAPERMTIELTPGNYIATCFIPAAGDGAPHFVHGMTQELVVT